MLKDKPTSLTDCIQACAVKVFKDATSPLSKLKNFQSTVETKTADFSRQQKLSNKFQFGGEVYIRPCATKSKTKWKIDCTISNYTRNCTAISRQLSPESLIWTCRQKEQLVQRNAKQKRDKQLKTLGFSSIFVLLVRKILNVNPDFKVWFITLSFQQSWSKECQ